jgi:hypothetical protein
MKAPDPPRVLALLSKDFGELANTLNLLAGVPVKARLLLTPGLLALNPVLAPHEVGRLGSCEAVIAELERFRPRLLLLMSGYLFGANHLFSNADLAAIVEAARRMGVRVATTDPFLGWWRGRGPQAQPLGTGNPALAAVADLLAAAEHLYPAPVATGPRAHAWYNPEAGLSGGARHSPHEESKGITAPFWLAVLSSWDFRLQCQLQGRAVFESRLLGLGAAAAAHGRRLLAVVPEMAAESLRALDTSGSDWQTACAYDRFKACVLGAEHAFYWNRLSNSVLTRLANERSAFFFAEGHLAHVLPEVGARACEAYFAGAPTPLLVSDTVVRLDVLSELARRQHTDLAPARQALQALPSATDLFARLLGEDKP